MARAVIMADNLPDVLLPLFGTRYEILPWSDRTVADRGGEIVGVVTYAHPRVDRALLERLPALRVVSNHGVGVDHIDVAAADALGIPVGNTPGCLDASTADMTMALLLSAARNVVIGDRFARSAGFTAYDPSVLIGREVTGSTLGIIGLGRIGREVARRARGFEMRVLYHNRRRDPEAEQALAAVYASRETLLAESDIVVLNCPLTPETTGLIGRDQLRLMKPTALLINVARGAVVDTDALIDALREGTIAGAALDVTEPEPLPRDHPLLSMESVVITPHLGSASDQTRRRMMEMTVANLEAGLSGSELPWRVRPPAD